VGCQPRRRDAGTGRRRNCRGTGGDRPVKDCEDKNGEDIEVMSSQKSSLMLVVN
jgi:hypothetical protein